jgi:hypothetical protein
MAQRIGGPRIAPLRPGAMGRVDVPAAVASRVRSEFEEMPGLCLTLHQASRLLGLDNATCQHLLGKLVADGFLAHERGKYRRLKDA